MPRVGRKYCISVSTLDYDDFHHIRQDEMEKAHSPSTDFTRIMI